MRFMTGLCLAGIYLSLGIEVVISWTPKHAVPALSWLVRDADVKTALPCHSFCVAQLRDVMGNGQSVQLVLSPGGRLRYGSGSW